MKKQRKICHRCNCNPHCDEHCANCEKCEHCDCNKCLGRNDE